MLEFTGERLIPDLNFSAAFYYEHMIRYLFAVHFAKGKTVLDVGCGEGYGSKLLFTHGKAKKVFGIDIDPASIKHAKKQYGSSSVQYAVDSAEKLSTIKDNSIDLVVCFELIEHIEDQASCFKNIKRVLKKGGIMVVSTPNKYVYPEGNPFHLKELYPKQFRALVSSFFKHSQTLYQSFHMAQVLQPATKAKTPVLKNSFTVDSTTSYTVPSVEKKEEYLVVVASDSKLPTLPSHVLTTKKVDFIDLHNGIIEFEKTYYSQSNHKLLEEENAYLKQSLDTITSAKFYKMWQKYCSIRDSLLKRNV
jgi:2-polyprenyl-3-methyl-5-hydroxy-6-metoxy-1,4-benzoquinol methylase